MMASNTNNKLEEEGTQPSDASSAASPRLINKPLYIRAALPLFLIVALNAVRLSSSSCGTKPQILWRTDGRCGRGFPAYWSSWPAQCDPNSDRPCCSDYGFCGNSPSHCECSACVDFRRNTTLPTSSTSSVVFSSEESHYVFKYIPPPIKYYVIPKSYCYFSYENETGYIESPNYPNAYPVGQDCCYDIKRPNQEFCGVSLLVEGLDVGRGEEGGFCRRDWISLPSCVPERGTRICGNKTGQYFQYLYQPGANAIRFEFHAGKEKENRKGFKIKYELLRKCPGPYQTQKIPINTIPETGGAPCYTRVTDPRGTINTPFFPETYPYNMDCVYEFVRTRYSICGIRMQSVHFVLEEPLMTPFGGACTDFLHLPSCGFLCGKVTFTMTVHFQPGATSLKFHFHSNENNTSESKLGFLINFEQVTKC